ncbi:oxidoreductase [Sphingomonas xinjiangensis]|uniref:Scyllo-inositol 2-dehydrogenase (NADP+) n=1 Tax=Sphingomonas xinjiangensis TaxID=643568 RepID=A0A840YE71_9SPHN|nr:oxidoreductase [Sphingomonas xinjiangensis]MBB5710585.1 scyllo-inositol 2-dehydrogenase (NADP+) [Sphingomonas xinjiangensis]
MIRTGLIGFGLGGTAFHAPLIAAVDGLVLSAVTTSRAEAVHAAYPQTRVATPDDVIADPAIDLVVISTPNATHYPLARAALEAGKHVVIDKPFAGCAEEARALVDLARANGRLAVPFHNRRWDSDFLTVRSLVEAGRLGEVLLYEAHWDRFRPEPSQQWKETPAAGAGQLLDLGPHLIDQALLLFGGPEAVSGDLAVQRAQGVIDDYFSVTLHYGARRVVLASSRMIAAPRPRFGIYGRTGSFVKFGLDPQEAAMRAGASVEDASHGAEDPSLYGVLTLPEGGRETIPSQRGDYRCFYAGIVSAIARGAPPPVAASDAILGLRIIDAARESAAEGRRIALV